MAGAPKKAKAKAGPVATGGGEGRRGDVATLRIELLDSDPLIWREVEIACDISLWELHLIVQAAMGWDDSHLWEMTVAGRRYGDRTRAMLPGLLRPRVTRIFYLYDFGDGWEHELVITKRRPAEPGVALPRLLGGANAAPPDDCGGIPGFYNLIDTLADPDHPDHAELREWFGDGDPMVWDEAATRAALAGLAGLPTHKSGAKH